MAMILGLNAKKVAARIHGLMTTKETTPLHILPYNRFTPDCENTWWLVPGSDNPAYAFGKYFCSDSEDHCEPGQVRCGLHVEKGIEESPENTAQRMLPEWEWHRFVSDMGSGKVSRAIEGAAAEVGESLQVDIVAKLGDQQEEFSARTTDGTLSDIKLKTSPGVKALGKLRECKQVSDVGIILEGEIRRAMRWGWIDLYISGVFSFALMNADQIVRCTKMLGKFEPWVRKNK